MGPELAKRIFDCESKLLEKEMFQNSLRNGDLDFKYFNQCMYKFTEQLMKSKSGIQPIVLSNQSTDCSVDEMYMYMQNKVYERC